MVCLAIPQGRRNFAAYLKMILFDYGHTLMDEPT